jgi:hypothetical protein
MHPKKKISSLSSLFPSGLGLEFLSFPSLIRPKVPVTMDSSTVKGKCKKNLIFKAWERYCRSLGAEENFSDGSRQWYIDKEQTVSPDLFFFFFFLKKKYILKF